MGYSIMTPFKSSIDKEKMLRFLGEHFRSFDTIGCSSEASYISAPTDDLSYSNDDGTPVVGFNYNSAIDDGNRNYAFTICCWMATAIGLEKPFETKEGDMTFKFILYDGFDEMPLVSDKSLLDKVEERIYVDETGFCMSFSEEFMRERMKKEYFLKRMLLNHKIDLARQSEELLRGELSRLNALWLEFEKK